MIRGKVRISVGEGLGVEIISKYIYKFYEQNPEIEIELLADTKLRSLSNRETDILISLSRPKKRKAEILEIVRLFCKIVCFKEFFKKIKYHHFKI